MTAKAADSIDMATVQKCTPPLTALLTIQQVAAWLQVGIRTVDSLELPVIVLSAHNIRYSVRQVLEILERRAA